MFKGLVRKEGVVYFAIGKDLIECPKKYHDTINSKLDHCPKKVTNVFACILNNRMVMQDILDYNMDEDITWQFIKTAIAVSNMVGKK